MPTKQCNQSAGRCAVRSVFKNRCVAVTSSRASSTYYLETGANAEEASANSLAICEDSEKSRTCLSFAVHCDTVDTGSLVKTSISVSGIVYDIQSWGAE